jgi:fatty acid desaturase
MTATYHHVDRLTHFRYQGGAVAYAVVAYVAGWIGIFQPSWVVAVPAVLLLAHSMIVAAYLVHECAHNTVFRHPRHNAMLGGALSWLCGAAYGTYEDIRYKHFRHHVDNDDVVWFGYDNFFERHPRITGLIRALEWLYIPAHDLLMHGIMMLTGFVIPQRRDQALRNLVVIGIRLGALAAVLVINPRAFLLYVVAYLILMHVLRFMDMLQHDYPYNLTLFEAPQSPHRGDAEWEQEHTFSNPLSLRYEKLNWLVLNFGFHNAHHADMRVPWYRLPALHHSIYGDDPERVIPLGSQLRLYHDNRLRRVHNPQPENYPKGQAYLDAARAGSGPIGGNAASFLTSF